MIKLNLTQTTPLIQEEDGTVRIAGSRITLDTLAGIFHRGASPEETQDCFPSLSRWQIHATIAYCLEHKAEVDAYLESRREEAEAIRREIENLQDHDEFQERLHARRAALVHS
jgi:uncharacterized protein (DUF433 family)